MTRKEVFAVSLAGTAVVVASLLSGDAQAAPTGAVDYARCARACADCRKACIACHAHCEAMMRAGAREHEKSLRLSADCRDICTVAAEICRRQGPMAAAICDACRQACDACGSECGKHADMAVMKACRESCLACAQACRELITALHS